MKLLKRINWFFRLVWRRVDCLEPGRIDAKTAWEVGKILDDL